MKHSIRTKITLLLTTMVILTILMTWIINSAFLTKYYMHIKVNKLYEAYNAVADIYQTSDTEELSEENISRIEQLETKYDVDVYVLNTEKETIFPILGDIGEREKSRTVDIEKDFSGFANPNVMNKQLIKDEKDYQIYTYYDKQIASSFINLKGLISLSDSETVTGTQESEAGSDNAITKVPSQDSGESSESITSEPKDTNGTLGDPNENQQESEQSSSSTDENTDNQKETIIGKKGAENPPGTEKDNLVNANSDQNINIIYLRSNTGSITESVKISNEFLAYVGILAVIIGTIAMFIATKKFTQPILDLSGIAKKMSDLDFDVKYKIKSNDEIGELGSSINTLSDKLETTILELKHANNELLTDIQRKTEIDEMRKEFLSNVSHELKTPIALIQGYAEGLKENIIDDEESRDFYCEVIMDEANKMNNMVKKLLSLNELEFGNNQVNFERFDIVALIQSVLNSTEIFFKQKEVALYFEQTEPIYVWADELLIEQVVTNYISNALNHVSDQKIVEIKLIERKDAVRVAVFNTGNKIPEDEIDKIWIKFYKIDKARTREYGGSGIGLSIVKAIMNSHNKECGAINRSIGVEFWFELDTNAGA